jgi:predicted RND superfamily exporter protein
VAGFLILASSAFQLNSGMGLLTAIVIILALLADFLFLPPLLIKIEEKFNAKELLAGNTASDSATS